METLDNLTCWCVWKTKQWHWSYISHVGRLFSLSVFHLSCFLPFNLHPSSFPLYLSYTGTGQFPEPVFPFCFPVRVSITCVCFCVSSVCACSSSSCLWLALSSQLNMSQQLNFIGGGWFGEWPSVRSAESGCDFSSLMLLHSGHCVIT